MVLWPWDGLVALVLCSHGGMAIAWLGGTKTLFSWHGHAMAWWLWGHILVVVRPWHGLLALGPRPHHGMAMAWLDGSGAMAMA